MSLLLSQLHNRDRVLIVEPGRLHPAVSFARASTATYMGPAGTLLTAAINAPRYEYDASGNYLGLLIEEARTNNVLNSATLVTQTRTVTAVAQTLSFYGTGTVTLSGVATGSLVGTGASNRVTLTFTPTAGSLTLTVTGSCTNGQLEVGAFATSYMPTTSAEVTRSADVAQVSSLSSINFNASEGAIIAEFDTFSNQALAAWTLMTPSAGYLTIYRASSATWRFRTSLANQNLVDGQFAATNKVAAAFAASNYFASVNGNAPIANPSAGAVPAVSTLQIGFTTSLGGIGALNGHIKRLSYRPHVILVAEAPRYSA